MKKKVKNRGKAEDHRHPTECAVYPDRTDRLRIPYGYAVGKLSGIVFLYQADIPCIRGTCDHRHRHDHLSDLSLCERR